MTYGFGGGNERIRALEERGRQESCHAPCHGRHERLLHRRVAKEEVRRSPDRLENNQSTKLTQEIECIPKSCHAVLI